MSKIDELAKVLIDSTEIKDKKKTSAYDTTARVVGVEGNVAWVSIAGGVEKTPAIMAVNAKVGDDVRVRVGGGKAYVTGNVAAPPTDDSTAKKAESAASRAARAANIADMKAETASKAADRATKDAAIAHEAADSAVADAAIAKASADSAVIDAATAKTSATTAWANLSQVQSVLEVVNWVSEHGTYIKATTFVADKTYYTVEATEVTDPTQQTDEFVHRYYELDDGIYVKTEDTEYDTSKTYYRVTGIPVPMPSAEDIAQYYVLDVGEAMGDYIQSHLALTNDGLYVMADDSEWRVLVASDGVYIINPNGDKVAKYKNVITLGLDTGTHSTVDSNGLHVWTGAESTATNEVASFGSTARIGKTNDYNLNISNGGFSFRDGLTEYININTFVGGNYADAYIDTHTSRSRAYIDMATAIDDNTNNSASVNIRVEKNASTYYPSTVIFAQRDDTVSQIRLLAQYSASNKAIIDLTANSSGKTISLTGNTSISGNVTVDGSSITMLPYSSGNSVILPNGTYLRLNSGAGSSVEWTEIYATTVSGTNNMYFQADGYFGWYGGDASHAPTARAYLTYAQFYTVSGVDIASGQYLKSTANGNTVTIGSQNTSYCHFSNSADRPFYFNKSIALSGSLGVNSYQYAAGGIYMRNNYAFYGFTAGTSGTARSLVTINSSNDIYFGYGSYSASANSVNLVGNVLNIISRGNINVTGQLIVDSNYIKNLYGYNNTASSATNMYIGSTGLIHRTTSTSSRRYKHDIKDVVNEELNPHHLYDIEVKQFKYNDDVITDEEDCRYGKDLIGFISEQVKEHFPIAVDLNEDGECEAWHPQYMVPPMLALIQEQHMEIENLKAEVNALKERRS